MRRTMVALLAGTLGLGGAGRALASEDEGRHEHQAVTYCRLAGGGPEDADEGGEGGRDSEDWRGQETRKDGGWSTRPRSAKNGKGTDIEVSAEGKVLERGKTHDEKSEPEHQRK